MVITEERPHQQNGPSSLARRRACHGSRWAEFGLPDTESEHSREGTEAHELLERLLGGGNPDGYEVPEMLSHIMGIVRWVDKFVALGYVLYSEVQVDGSPVLGPHTAGTADIILVKDEHIIIADLKYGHYEVQAIDNPQLIAYAAGAACEKSIVPVSGEPNFSLYILQPRLYRGAPIKSTELSFVQIQPLWDSIRIDLALCTDSAERTPTADACRYCKANLSCTERVAEAIQSIKEVLNVVDQELPLEAEMMGVGIEGLPPAAIASLLDLKPLIDAIFTDIQAEAFKGAKRGIIIPGYKIIQGPGRRNWDLTKEELARKWKSLKIPMTDYLVSKMNSPSQMEKLESVKALSDKQRENIKQFYSKTPGKETLVPSTTSGTEVVYNSAEAFTNAGAGAPIGQTVEVAPAPLSFL